MKNFLKRKYYSFIRHKIFKVAFLGLTYECQCSCIHCGMGLYKRDVKNELDKNEWMEIIKKISQEKNNVIAFFRRRTNS